MLLLGPLQWGVTAGISIFKEGALMDVLILVHDLDRAIPPIEIDQDLEVVYD